MTAKPINPSFAEFSGDAPILWGSRTQVRQKLLRKWSKQSVSSELTQPEINIPPRFHGELTAGSSIGGKNGREQRGQERGRKSCRCFQKFKSSGSLNPQTADFSGNHAVPDR